MRRIITIVFCWVLSTSPLSQVYAGETQLSEEEARVLDAYNKKQIGIDPISRKYLTGVLYVGMPEEEFVKIFTWDASFKETVKPYIIKHVKNIYYIKVIFPRKSGHNEELDLV